MKNKMFYEYLWTYDGIITDYHLAAVCVVVNFMHQFGWDSSYTDIWSNIILCASVAEFLDKINIQIDGLRVKQVALHNCEWALPNQLKA